LELRATPRRLRATPRTVRPARLELRATLYICGPRSTYAGHALHMRATRLAVRAAVVTVRRAAAFARRGGEIAQRGKHAKVFTFASLRLCAMILPRKPDSDIHALGRAASALGFDVEWY